MDTLSTELRDLASEIARTVGTEARARRRKPITFSTKTSSTDVVTEIDTWSESVIVERLLAARPDDGIVGEEGAAHKSSSGVTWVIDPIDGTTNLLYDLPGYNVSIAARTDEHVIAGAVYDPVRQELFAAARGHGATRTAEIDGTVALAPSSKADLATALVGTGFSYLPERRAEQAIGLQTLLPRVRDIRRLGSAALDLCAVACGRLDAYYERGLAPWDEAAGGLIAQEAGATVVLGNLTIAAAPDIAHELQQLLVAIDA